MFDKCSYGREASTLLARDRGATLTRTTSDFCSGSPPSLRSVEDDKRGTLMCFYDVEDDIRGSTLVLEDDGRERAGWLITEAQLWRGRRVTSALDPLLRFALSRMTRGGHLCAF